MRRASFSLLFALKLSPKTLSSLLSPQTLTPLPLPIPFPRCPFPSRPIQTLSETTLHSLTTPDQILAAFKSIDSSLKSEPLSPNDLIETLDFALKALKIFEGDAKRSVSVVKTLRLIGSISCKLDKFEDSLESLNTAIALLDGLEMGGFRDSEGKLVRLELLVQLAETNSAMGRKLDALISLKKAVELRELMGESNSPEMGAACKDLGEAYAVVSDFKAALPLCLKAVDIFVAHYGHNLVKAAHTRQFLSVVYVGLEENDKALEQNEVARGIFTGLGLEGDILDSEIEAANIKIAMGKPGEGIEILKSVIQRVSKESEVRAFVFVAMARALCILERFGESKRCLEIACGVLDKLESFSSSKVYETYSEISMLYEMMNEFEIALPLMNRTLEIVRKLPREQHLEGGISARIGWLLLLTRRADQAIPFLERGEKRLRDSFGKIHFGLGFVSKHLGQAYLETGKPTQAVQMLENAYNILSRWFGPYHEDSIDACQCLANAYATKASISPVETIESHYASAMEFQQRVIKAWEKHGPDASDDLREAYRLFEQLKRKAEGSPSAVFPANTLPVSTSKNNGPLQKEGP